VTVAERLLFGAGWRRYGRTVARAGGRVDVDLRVEDSRLDRYLTLVSRPPPDVALRVAGVSGRLAAADPGHYLYPPGDLHLTVVDCSALLGAGDLDDAIARLSNSLAAALTTERPAPVRLLGVNVSPATAYVQAWDTTGGIRRIRGRVRAQLNSGSPFRDRLSFVNVIRFLRPVSPVLVEAVGQARTVDLGSFQLATLELVLTDKMMSASATSVVADYRLKGGETA
jgi:2'-5' RNA ligase